MSAELKGALSVLKRNDLKMIAVKRQRFGVVRLPDGKVEWWVLADRKFLRSREIRHMGRERGATGVAYYLFVLLRFPEGYEGAHLLTRQVIEYNPTNGARVALNVQEIKLPGFVEGDLDAIWSKKVAALPV